MDITSSKRENRPFILSKTPKPTLLPSNYHNFDERVESFIRFVQGANTFVAIGLVYLTAETLYYHFSYLNECQTYSLLLIAVMVHNLLWFIGSIIGFKAINSRSAKSILRFFFLMVFLFLSRIGVYVALYVTMGEVSIDKYYCDAVYEGGLYIMEAIIEGVFFLIMLPMIFAIRNYVQAWEKEVEGGSSLENNFY